MTQRNRSRGVSRIAAALLLSALGCDDPLKEAQTLEGPRVLGVRVSGTDDAASVERGQSARVEVLVADANGPLDARLAFELCTAVDARRGVPSCDGEALTQGSVDWVTEPLVVDLPESLPNESPLALLGVACPTGEPRLHVDPARWRCSGGSSPLRFSFDLWSRGPNFENTNPDLSELSVRVSGLEITLDDPNAGPSCDDANVVAANTTHDVEIALGEAAREPLDAPSRSTEALQLSHFSTRGTFARHYSFVTAENEPRVNLEWESPTRNQPVKQYLVVRDGRGGVAWTSWSLCAR